MIIDWKKISEKIYENLKKEIIEVKNISDKITLWAILVWENSPSLRYIKQKKKFCEQVWINFELKTFAENVSENELMDFLELWNSDKNISGYIVQLPLPENINTTKILNKIKPEKDVDWFHPVNQWKVLVWDVTWFSPCTPAWVIEILEYLNVDLSWKEVVVIGKSNIVWKPVTAMLINLWATVISCNSKTKDLSKFTKSADIVVCAAWKPWLLKQDMINEKTIIIDVWFTVINEKIYGDADFENINNNWNLITPVPGWVWRLTVANLLKNTFKAYKLWNI